MRDLTNIEHARLQATDLLKLVIEHQQIAVSQLSNGTAAAKWCAEFIDEMAKRLEAMKSGR